MRIKQIVFVEALGYLLVLTHGISSLKSSQLGYTKGNANNVWWVPQPIQMFIAGRSCYVFRITNMKANHNMGAQLSLLVRSPQKVMNRMMWVWTSFYEPVTKRVWGPVGEWLPDVILVRTEHSEVRTEMTKGYYSTLQLNQATTKTGRRRVKKKKWLLTSASNVYNFGHVALFVRRKRWTHVVTFQCMI